MQARFQPCGDRAPSMQPGEGFGAAVKARAMQLAEALAVPGVTDIVLTCRSLLVCHHLEILCGAVLKARALLAGLVARPDGGVESAWLLSLDLVGGIAAPEEIIRDNGDA